MTPAAAVAAADLARRWGGRWALANVSLEVAAGESLLVAGRNGAGKSTLLALLATALAPHAGSLRLAGVDALTQRGAARRQLAYLAHHAHTYETLTALENLRLAARLGAREDASDAELTALLDETGLAERRNDVVGTFSVGMRRRLALARLLLRAPAVAILDEPHAGLDAPGFALVARIVARLRERGAAVILASHLYDEASRLCDRAVLLEGGRLVWSGPPTAAAVAAALAAQPGAA